MWALPLSFAQIPCEVSIAGRITVFHRRNGGSEKAQAYYTSSQHPHLSFCTVAMLHYSLNSKISPIKCGKSPPIWHFTDFLKYNGFRLSEKEVAERI